MFRWHYDVLIIDVVGFCSEHDARQRQPIQYKDEFFATHNGQYNEDKFESDRESIFGSEKEAIERSLQASLNSNDAI